MADSTISNLPVLTPTGSTVTLLDNGATTGKTTLANLALWLLNQGGAFGVNTYAGRSGAVTPQASDVSTALGFTLSGTAAQSYTLPTTTATLARTDAGQTFTGTQVFGAITAATINGETITPSGGTFSLTTGKTFAVTNTITLSGTDSTVMTFPTTSATLARIDAANIFTGTQTIGALVATTVNGNTITAGTGTLTLAAAKTLTATNSLTLSGTDGTVVTFPTTSDTVVGLNQTQTFLGNYTFSNPLTIASATAAGHAVNKGQLAVPQITVLTSGSGTYTTPANAKYLTVKMVGGGGGGMGGGTGGTAGAGGNGTGSLFGTSLLTCTAGAGGILNYAGQPGSGTVNAPAVGVGLLGGYGAPNVFQAVASYTSGGNGGNSAFGAGGGGAAAGIANTYAGGTNTGAGGGGGSLANTTAGAYSGSGGGAGGYVEAMIPASLNSTYAYTVGTGGTAGAGGTGGASGGGVGGSGVIIVTAYFLP